MSLKGNPIILDPRPDVRMHWSILRTTLLSALVVISLLSVIKFTLVVLILENNVQVLEREVEALRVQVQKLASDAEFQQFKDLSSARTKRNIDDSREVKVMNPDVRPRLNNNRHKSVAAHYYGFADYNPVDCNGFLWRESTWMTSISSTHGFQQVHNGIQATHAGLYFIYAQLYYSHTRNLSGFTVMRNEVSLMTCAVSSHTKEPESKTNSCYVASLAYLKSGDVLRIQNHHSANCIMHPDKTYFGAVRMTDFKVRDN